MYIGAPYGGLWKSINGGVIWSANTDDLVAIGVSDLAIDPSNSLFFILTSVIKSKERI